MAVFELCQYCIPRAISCCYILRSLARLTLAPKLREVLSKHELSNEEYLWAYPAVSRRHRSVRQTRPEYGMDSLLKLNDEY